MAKKPAEKRIEKVVEELFQAPAEIMKLETMSDGGVRIVVDTQEITDPNDLAKLFQLKKGSHGWFLFKNATIVSEDVPEYNPESTDTDQSPSKRLRAVMFVYWKEVLNGKGGDFDAWYRNAMNQLIDRYKEKLPPRGE